jgi:hypothetical protein
VSGADLKTLSSPTDDRRLTRAERASLIELCHLAGLGGAARCLRISRRTLDVAVMGYRLRRRTVERIRERLGPGGAP